MMRTLQVGELSQVQGGGHGSGLAASLNLGGISVSTHVGLGSSLSGGLSSLTGELGALTGSLGGLTSGLGLGSLSGLLGGLLGGL